MYRRCVRPYWHDKLLNSTILVSSISILAINSSGRREYSHTATENARILTTYSGRKVQLRKRGILSKRRILNYQILEYAVDDNGHQNKVKLDKTPRVAAGNINMNFCEKNILRL
jgi:hypothetical protein